LAVSVWRFGESLWACCFACAWCHLSFRLSSPLRSSSKVDGRCICLMA
jgi:hypothetical protein